jgi:hypothetical protein
VAATLLEETELEVIECNTAEAALAAMETRANGVTPNWDAK